MRHVIYEINVKRRVVVAKNSLWINTLARKHLACNPDNDRRCQIIFRIFTILVVDVGGYAGRDTDGSPVDLRRRTLPDTK